MKMNFHCLRSGKLVLAFLYAILGLISLGQAQSVLNGSFENFVGPPYPAGYGPGYFGTEAHMNIEDWTNTGYTIPFTYSNETSPDYFHTNNNLRYLPYNGGGFPNCSQANGYRDCGRPHSGSAVVHIWQTPDGVNGMASPRREWIMGQFDSPLIVGQPYTFSFWIRHTEHDGSAFKVVMKHFGAAFFTQNVAASLDANATTPLFWTVTHHFKSNAYISDTAWTQLSYTFTADSAYQYFATGIMGDMPADVYDPTYYPGSSVGANMWIDDFEIQPGILPIRENSFHTHQNGTAVVAQWESEFNENGQFTLQKSHDGSTFSDLHTEIYEEKGSMMARFRTIDLSPYSPYGYYRLKEVGVDGTVAYSEIVRQEFQSESFAYAILLSPNPSSGAVSLTMEVPEDGEAFRIQIVNVFGAMLMDVEAQPQQGKLRATVDMQTWPAGIYYAVVRHPNGKVVGKQKLVRL